MALLPLDIPPGIFRNGTKYEAKGRWYDANLVRWVEGVMQPFGGWQPVNAGGSDLDVSAPVLGMFVWRDNSGNAWLALGTPSTAHIFSEGAVADFTPSGFTTGSADATTTQNYGAGNYGEGVYGEGDPAQATITEAQSWQFDNFGQTLVAMSLSDGKLYSWTPPTTSTALAVVDPSAPTSNSGLVVTPERFLVAIGADGDGRKVAWADQESLTDWTATSTNQAGDFNLPGAGELLTGRRVKNETLIWSTTDVFSMRYIGGQLVYQFQQIGAGAGAISRRAVAVADGGRAYWMGQHSFWRYDGSVVPVPSEVSDYVFTDINRVQSSKIHAVPVTDFNAVMWFYPSAGSNEIDRYVSYNYQDNVWTIGQLNRTAGVDRGPFSYPMMGDSNGTVYDHERDDSYLDIDGSTELTPSATSGPVEIGNGDQIMVVQQIIPDEKTLGDVQARLFASAYPTATETEFGPFTLSNPTSVRLSGRQVRLKLEQVKPNWRVGVPRLEVEAGEQR